MKKKRSDVLLTVLFVLTSILACINVTTNARAITSQTSSPVVEDSSEWYTIDSTYARSVFIEDVEADGQKEIITAGHAYNGSWNFGQLRIWKMFGTILLLAGHQEWYTKGWTEAWSVCVDDLDNDGLKEIVTGGFAFDGVQDNAQLRIWSWNDTAVILETSVEWYTTSHTRVISVFVCDVDADGRKEIITGGRAYDNTRNNGQLTIWNYTGTTLNLEKTQEWYTTSDTDVNSVFADDVDADGVIEIITGGFNFDTIRTNGQLRIWSWNGATLILEASQEWYTTNWTFVLSVFVSDVDGDSAKEIVTGGYAFDDTRDNGQLRIWSWNGIVLALEKSHEWYTVDTTHSSWALYVEDVDSDGIMEIITGGFAFNGAHVQAQLRTWHWIGSEIILETSQEWPSRGNTEVVSIRANDIDSDGISEIVTAGYCHDGKRYNGQLRIWAVPIVDSLRVDIDVGTTHFRGEIVEAYILVSYRGALIFPTAIPATLFCPDGSAVPLVVEYVSTGLYRTKYATAADAKTGTYTIMVEAQYKTNAKNLQGANLKSFQISPTLTQWNSWLVAIQQDMGTVKTDVGLIKLNLSQINATITAIDDNIATIETNIGLIKADLSLINLESLPSIADSQANQNTSLYITIALSALAAIGAIGALVMMLRKRKTN